MNDVLVTVGMPVRNEGAFVEQAIRALLDQTFHRFRLVVSDNASSDDTADICRQLSEEDPRVLYERLESDVGALENFNRVARRARSKYFMWASGHDLARPRLLERTVHALEADDRVVLACTAAHLIDADGRTLGTMPRIPNIRGKGALGRYWTVSLNLQNGNPIYGLIRKAALDRTPLARRVVSADMILLGELAAAGPWVSIDEPLWCRREVRSPESGVDLLRRQLRALFGSTPDYGVVGAYLRLALRHMGSVRGLPSPWPLRPFMALAVAMRYGIVVPWRWLVRRRGSVRVDEE